jgi:hypothetical protein
LREIARGERYSADDCQAVQFIPDSNCTGHNCHPLILYRPGQRANTWDMRSLLPNFARRLPSDDDRSASISDPTLGRALANSVALEAGQLWSIAGGEHGPIQITCVTGQVWITQTGDAQDHVLSTGGSFTASGGAGKIVVQAMTRANISIGAD